MELLLKIYYGRTKMYSIYSNEKEPEDATLLIDKGLVKKTFMAESMIGEKIFHLNVYELTEKGTSVVEESVPDLLDVLKQKGC